MEVRGDSESDQLCLGMVEAGEGFSVVCVLNDVMSYPWAGTIHHQSP